MLTCLRAPEVILARSTCSTWTRGEGRTCHEPVLAGWRYCSEPAQFKTDMKPYRPTTLRYSTPRLAKWFEASAEGAVRRWRRRAAVGQWSKEPLLFRPTHKVSHPKNAAEGEILPRTQWEENT